MCARSSSADLAPYSAANLSSSELSRSVVGLRPNRRASLSNNRLPRSMLRVRSSPWRTCLILLRARDVATNDSQSRLGFWAPRGGVLRQFPFFRGGGGGAH